YGGRQLPKATIPDLPIRLCELSCSRALRPPKPDRLPSFPGWTSKLLPRENCPPGKWRRWEFASSRSLLRRVPKELRENLLISRRRTWLSQLRTRFVFGSTGTPKRQQDFTPKLFPIRRLTRCITRREIILPARKATS